MEAMADAATAGCRVRGLLTVGPSITRSVHAATTPQGYVQLPGQRLGIGDANVVEAHFLCQARPAGNIREIVGEHGDAEFHGIHNSPLVSRC